MTPLLKRAGHRTVPQTACSRGVTRASHRKQLVEPPRECTRAMSSSASRRTAAGQRPDSLETCNAYGKVASPQPRRPCCGTATSSISPDTRYVSGFRSTALVVVDLEQGTTKARSWSRFPSQTRWIGRTTFAAWSRGPSGGPEVLDQNLRRLQSVLTWNAHTSTASGRPVRRRLVGPLPHRAQRACRLARDAVQPGGQRARAALSDDRLASCASTPTPCRRSR
jgi:hypothetical protein